MDCAANQFTHAVQLCICLQGLQPNYYYSTADSKQVSPITAQVLWSLRHSEDTFFIHYEYCMLDRKSPPCPDQGWQTHMQHKQLHANAVQQHP